LKFNPFRNPFYFNIPQQKKINLGKNMEKKKLDSFYKKAYGYVEEEHPEELKWAQEMSESTFKNLKSKTFLAEYCWVVFAAGFKVDIVEEKFPDLKAAYKGFDLDKLSRMRSIKPVLEIINHEQKAQAVLDGAKQIHEEGFSKFKKRLKEGGMNALQSLPYIGGITQKHLAKNIGLADVAKDDVWLERVKDKYSADSVEELVDYLSAKFKQSKHVVDVVLWRFSADKKKVE
jgi:3-methyladenine DNA glycosylase Tag